VRKKSYLLVYSLANGKKNTRKRNHKIANALMGCLDTNNNNNNNNNNNSSSKSLTPRGLFPL
jgi:hypothetical protein